MLIKVTRTSAGCILGRFALGAPRLTAEQVGRRAAEELLEALEAGERWTSTSRPRWT